MSNYETIYLLEHSIEQINALRRTVEELEPRAHAYDTITQILALRDDGRRNHCAQVDLVYELKEKVARLRAEAEAAAPVSGDASIANAHIYSNPSNGSDGDE